MSYYIIKENGKILISTTNYGKLANKEYFTLDEAILDVKRNNPKLNKCRVLFKDYYKYISLTNSKKNKRNKQRTRVKRGNIKYSKENSKKISKTGVGSLLEYKVLEYLKQYNVYTLNQYNCKLLCYNPKTGKRLPYDFEIPKIKVVIEVQGPQHYRAIKMPNGSMSDYHAQAYRDNIKETYAKDNGYREVKIRYSAFNSGEYKMILQDLIREYNS